MGLEGKWDLGQKKVSYRSMADREHIKNNNDIRNTKLFNLSKGPRRHY